MTSLSVSELVKSMFKCVIYPRKRRRKINKKNKNIRRVSRREVSKIVKCFKHKRELYPVDKGK